MRLSEPAFVLVNGCQQDVDEADRAETRRTEACEAREAVIQQQLADPAFARAFFYEALESYLDAPPCLVDWRHGDATVAGERLFAALDAQWAARIDCAVEEQLAYDEEK
jgi:hypothetical protein